MKISPQEVNMTNTQFAKTLDAVEEGTGGGSALGKAHSPATRRVMAVVVAVVAMVVGLAVLRSHRGSDSPSQPGVPAGAVASATSVSPCVANPWLLADAALASPVSLPPGC
jgi:hypothetical protein